MPEQKKAYVLDTSVLMHDPAAIEKFADNIVLVPLWVLRELDRLKEEPGAKGATARSAIRLLDSYRKQGLLGDGIALPAGGTLYVPDFEDDAYGLPHPTTDERIIFTARTWAAKHPGTKVLLVSKDISMRVLANSFRVQTDDYLHDKPIHSLDELYSGVTTITLAPSETDLIQRIYQDRCLSFDLVQQAVRGPLNFLSNQCCVLRDSADHTALALFKKEEQLFRLVERPKKSEAQRRIVPINDEQCFALALLKDPAISLVTLVGRAGAGKTLMSLLAGNDQLDNYYQQLIVYRPNIELGHPIGYLPGTWQEKFEPWMKPIFDNLELILMGSANASSGAAKGKPKNYYATIERMFQDKRLTVEPINFIQGRTLHHAFVIADEAQNLTPAEMKMLITRMGEGSKMVLTGDPEQIASRFLDTTSNGLTYVIERMKGQELYGHITMKKTERSALAELAAQLL